MYSLKGKIVDEQQLQRVQARNVVSININGVEIYKFATEDDGSFNQNNDRLKDVYETHENSITVIVQGYQQSRIDRFQTSPSRTAGGNQVGEILMRIRVLV